MEKPIRDLLKHQFASIVRMYNWQPIMSDEDFEAFLGEVDSEIKYRLSSIRPQILEDAARNSVLFYYCRLWHAACKQAGSIKQYDAFRSLFEYVYKIALEKTNGNEVIAQDITQDVLISIWRSLDSVREPGAFLQFVRRVTERQAWHEFSKLNKYEMQEEDYPVSHDEDPEFLYQEDPETGIHEPIEEFDESETDLTDLIEIIVRCLPSEDRQKVIVDSFIYNKSIKEIAEEMRKSPNTVSVLKNRAMQQLRSCEELKEYQIGYANRPNRVVSPISRIF